MRLHEWQRAVQDCVLSFDAEHENAVLPWIKQANTLSDSVDAASPDAKILHAKTIDAETRLGVYVDAYFLRHCEALRENYPAVHQLLGDNDFDALAQQYLRRHPSAHASIRWFGEHLAVFMKAEAPYCSVPAMAELAEFEWALRHTIDAADAEVLTPAFLQSSNATIWGDFTFRLHPSLTILRLHWNAPQIWRALTNQEKPPTPEPQNLSWLVYRQPDLVSGWRSASTTELKALDVIHRGLSFADLCAALANQTDDVDAVPMMAATFLRDWVAQGLLALRDTGVAAEKAVTNHAGSK